MAVNNEERDHLVRSLRQFAEREVKPRVARYDAEERIPPDLLTQMAGLDLFGGTVPLEWGGTALDHLTYATLIEEISKYDHVLGVLMSMPSALVGAGILAFGTEEQKKRYLVPLAKGQTFGGAGVTEPQSGSDVAGTRTRYRQVSDGYVINGRKAWISNLDIASFFVMFAVREGEEGRTAMSAFVVPSDAPGLIRNPFRNKLGFRPICTGELAFDDVVVPPDALIGQEGEGFQVAMIAVERGRLSVAARAVGLAQACLDDSIAWAKERTTFGRRIASYQQVGAKLADMAMQTRAARLLVRECAEAIDAGRSDARLAASIAKCYASDVAQRVATDAVQIHGAHGVAEEVRVSRCYRDAKVFQIVEGTNEVQRNIIASTLTGLKGMPG
ncbi:acyl-CoA dehydrogenase family protein [Actinophytocola sp.]|uniref:acyl-CoA dehydrogenase family protein n=1 Tax=Actinophytocola sp. TaxID=1872138 RepID=UPI003D6A55A3